MKLAEAVEKANQFMAAVNTFNDYQRRLIATHRYDFADMILWTSAAFDKSPAILSRYQEQFQYVLVDEFQDTSGAQYDLLVQLTDYSDSPNVFAVGDDDQSIYRFQGASVENMMRYQERFGDRLTTIALIENHRSSQNILDSAGALISRNVERLAIDKKLQAVNPEVSLFPEKVQILSYSTLMLESSGVAHQILELKNAGVPLSNFAVIYRNHRQSDELIRFLAAKDIPVAIRRRANVLSEPLTIKLLDVLQYLSAELRRPNSGEAFLFRFLHDSWFKVSPISIARLSAHVSRKSSVADRAGEGATTWRDELLSTDCPGLSGEEVELLSSAGRLVEELIEAAATMPLSELLHFVCSRTGLLDQALSNNDQVWNLQILNTLFDFVKDESAKMTLGLQQLMSLITDMNSQGTALPIEKLAGEGEGVNFVTAHGSKGLEFEDVFLVGSTSKAWDSSGKSRTYALPPTVWRGAAGSEEEESRRLFYVSMTRAKRQLHISFSGKDNNDKALEQSRFVAELVESGLVIETVKADNEGLIAFGAEVLKAVPTRERSLFNDEFVAGLLKGYALSVSHLSAYLKCPVSFYFTRLLKSPVAPSIASAFGLAVHSALEVVFNAMIAAEPRVFPGAEIFMAEFRRHMKRNEADFSPVEFRRRMEYAEAVLPLFYREHSLVWRTDSLVEVGIRTTVDGVPVKGTLDRVELLDQTGNIDIADSKSGNYLYAKKKLNGPDPEKVAKAEAEGKKPCFEAEYGGDYWRQAVFYRILAESDPDHDWNVDKVRFEFVEPDKTSGKFQADVVSIDQSDVDTVKNQIKDVYGSIQSKHFADGCGDPDCGWCNFVERVAA